MNWTLQLQIPCNVHTNFVGFSLVYEYLGSIGTNLQPIWVKNIIRMVDPDSSRIRWAVGITTKLYQVKGPNSFWHIDGNDLSWGKPDTPVNAGYNFCGNLCTKFVYQFVPLKSIWKILQLGYYCWCNAALVTMLPQIFRCQVRKKISQFAVFQLLFMLSHTYHLCQPIPFFWHKDFIRKKHSVMRILSICLISRPCNTCFYFPEKNFAWDQLHMHITWIYIFYWTYIWPEHIFMLYI